MTFKSGMQMVDFIPRTCRKTGKITSAVRNASCSRGWLHLAVQTIFGTITVTSFILIVIWTTLSSPAIRPVIDNNRCHLQYCRIICEEAPYFDRYFKDIVRAVLRAGDDGCKKIQLSLHRPMFVNETFPVRLWSSTRYRLHELSIYGGNLMHIPNEAFMDAHIGAIDILLLHNLTIKTWTQNSFSGLSYLRELHIKYCSIISEEIYILKPVVESLFSLTITESGYWNPASITGFTKLPLLSTVDFSLNDFRNLLGQNSFSGLSDCKILYLNSCKITSIGPGTFDKLVKIKILYLNNNFLTTIPDGLFHNTMMLSQPRPRINLQYNPWHCDCTASDLIKLTAMGMLLTNPSCLSPEDYKGKKITELLKCVGDEDEEEKDEYKTLVQQDTLTHISDFIYISNGCYNGYNVTTNSSLQMFSPVRARQCYSSKQISRSDMEFQEEIEEEVKGTDWMKFVFFIKTGKRTSVQISASQTNNFGLLWYLSSCPNEVYCINSVPESFRVYNVDLTAKYIFCPISLSSGSVVSKKCKVYENSTSKEFDYETLSIRFGIYVYICIGFVCLSIGAIFVYALIRKYPNLLKGSNRILFVKHKTVDALVLPPKVPLRKNVTMTDDLNESEDNKIFVVPDTANSIFSRMKSTRSSKSNAPSYISALQPTDDQLAEWRIRHHFNNDLSITSVTTEISGYSLLYNEDTVYYPRSDDNDVVYKSLK